ncbi:MAG: DinB family protein [Kibdelosporangium sp.]
MTTAMSTTELTTATTRTVTGERADLLETLAKHRHFLRHTLEGLTDEQAGLRTTVSELCLGGLVKHVTVVEWQWINFVIGGAAGMVETGSREDEFRMLEGDTVTGVLERYEEVARRTDELVVSLPDLDASHPLPVAPWFEPGAKWSARRVLLHIIAETSQHAGHADIIREALDGSKTMG